MKRLLAAAFLALAALPAAAQEPDCTDPVTQSDMNICADRDYQDADAELNAAWKEARASADQMDAEYDDDLKGAAKALIAAQRSWIAYRDGKCELAGFDARGGSMEPMLVSGCLAEETRRRTRELKAFVSGDEQ